MKIQSVNHEMIFFSIQRNMIKSNPREVNYGNEKVERIAIGIAESLFV